MTTQITLRDSLIVVITTIQLSHLSIKYIVVVPNFFFYIDPYFAKKNPSTISWAKYD